MEENDMTAIPEGTVTRLVKKWPIANGVELTYAPNNNGDTYVLVTPSQADKASAPGNVMLRKIIAKAVEHGMKVNFPPETAFSISLEEKGSAHQIHIAPQEVQSHVKPAGPKEHMVSVLNKLDSIVASFAAGDYRTHAQRLAAGETSFIIAH